MITREVSQESGVGGQRTSGIFAVFDSLDASYDEVVPRLGRGSARTGAAEVVFGCAAGPAWPSGRYCAVPLDGSGSEADARSTGKAAPGPNRMMLRNPDASDA